MLEDSFSDNLRQTGVVMNNEFRKYFRGKSMTIFTILLGLVLFLNIALPYIVGDGLSKDPTELAYSFASAMLLIIIMSATLFTSGSIASEFEERTALVLFTKPLKKWSVFLGKFISACMIGFAFILIYYAILTCVSLIVTGSTSPHLPVSLGLAFACMFGSAGVAVLISSVSKKFGLAAILTFVLMLLIMPLISSMLSLGSIDPWFMLDEGAYSVGNVFLHSGASEFLPSSTAPDVGRSAVVMLVWGAVTSIIGYLIFRRREV